MCTPVVRRTHNKGDLISIQDYGGEVFVSYWMCVRCLGAGLVSCWLADKSLCSVHSVEGCQNGGSLPCSWELFATHQAELPDSHSFFSVSFFLFLLRFSARIRVRLTLSGWDLDIVNENATAHELELLASQTATTTDNDRQQLTTTADKANLTGPCSLLGFQYEWLMSATLLSQSPAPVASQGIRYLSTQKSQLWK